MLQTEVNKKTHLQVERWEVERWEVEREKKGQIVTRVYVLDEICIQCIELKCIPF